MRSIFFPVLACMYLAGCDLNDDAAAKLPAVETVTGAELVEQQRRMAAQMKALIDRVQILEEEREGMLEVIAKAETLQKYVLVTLDGDIAIMGANLRVTNNEIVTRVPIEGKGNLFLGPATQDSNQIGSHNLIMGTANTVTGSYGLVIGANNTIGGVGAVAIGESNEALDGSVAIGGFGNVAEGRHSSSFGGSANKSNGKRASVFGGTGNVAGGVDAVVLGGFKNHARHEISTVVGSHSVSTEATGQSLINQDLYRTTHPY